MIELDGSSVIGGAVDGNASAIGIQIVGSIVGSLWSFTITGIIVYAMSKISIPWFNHPISLNLRMSEPDELAGTDYTCIGEVGYDFSHSGQKYIQVEA